MAIDAQLDRRWPQFGNRRNLGAYEQPFSGVGMEFDPLGSPPVETEIALHEVGYWPENYDWNYLSVYSPFWRAYYDFQPGHAVRFGQRDTSLGPHALVVIPNHQRFDCLGDQAVPKLWLDFSCDWNVEPQTPMPITIPRDRVLGPMLAEFPYLFRAPPSAGRPQIRRLGLAMLVYLLGSHRIPRQRRLPDRIADVVQRINQRPAHPWRNPQLAASVSMGTESFIRLFKRWTGETPIRYVQQVRIREACRLLSETRLPIDEIALRTGFPDRFYFSRVFKRHTSRSPAAYRRDIPSHEAPHRR